ncbi:hypothetical protein RZS08_20385, partial [Arthrospira platensis SPKY1]|nr:hypothetical protein [Arthrospira platensis SPKY1]
HYEIAPVINPDGYDKKNSITDSSRIDVNVELELPIWGKAEDFVAHDTINFSFNSLFEDIEKADEFDDIDWILLRMHYNNGFPAELETNVFFLRDVRNNYEIIDSLDFGEKMIYPAITDNQGDVVRHYSG